VIVSYDKDMKTIPGVHLSDGKPVEVSKRQADLAFYCQALTGDTSDNYPGCPKYGPVAAAKALDGLLDERDMWAAVLAAYEKAGFNERYAIAQARCARILRSGEYDHERGIPLLWNPPVT
jgi:DNA polymerase-1